MQPVSPFRNHVHNAINRVSRPVMGRFLGWKVKEAQRRRSKLVMTLLVRDEVDIVRGNLEFHYDHGVDFIVATDNGSTDGTCEILEEYQRKGRLFLIREPSQDYSQMLWVNRMGEIAHRDYKADLIFHADADEFWLPDSGSLKNELIDRVDADVLKVPVINILPANARGTESFPQDTIHAVTNPLYTDNLKEDSASVSLYLFQYDPKVMYRLDQGYRQVNQGNHNIITEPGSPHREDRSRDVRILHYPIRSRKHFFQKIRNGGAAYERNVSLGKNVGWQWRMWYESYKENKLDQVYNGLTLSAEQIRPLTRQGIVCNWSRVQQHLSSYL
jgi:glycosyltransferase involved in cell wall biosynthesis